MTLLDKLKSLLGLEPAGSEPESRGDVDVTVEREPGAPSEAGRQGTAGAAEPAETAETEPEPAAPTEDAAEEIPGAEAVDEAEPAEPEAAEEPQEPPESEPGGAEAGEAAEPETGASAESGAAGESTDVIEGIGPTYADRLADEGVETVGDLADADAAELAERADLPESRLERWIERARDR